MRTSADAIGSSCGLLLSEPHAINWFIGPATTASGYLRYWVREALRHFVRRYGPPNRWIMRDSSLLRHGRGRRHPARAFAKFSIDESYEGMYAPLLIRAVKS